MKAWDMQATQDNIVRTFLEDTIGRNKDVVQFCNLLGSIDGCFSIALDGKWGSGKTFFMNHVKMLLDLYNTYSNSSIENDKVKQIKKIVDNLIKPDDQNFSQQVVVYYDSWTNDNDDDSILSLIYSIIKSENIDNVIMKQHDYLKLAGSIADIITGRKISEFFNAIKGEDKIDSIKKEKSINELIREFFNELLHERGDRLVIIIDELDRCKPSYAVRLLERIKHYFDDERITFIFSTNIEQLHYTVQNFYGNGFDATRYLDRFFNLRIELPQANLDLFYKSLEFNQRALYIDLLCCLMIKKYNFSLREIIKYINWLKIVMNNYIYFEKKPIPNREINYSLNFILPIMLGLKIINTHLYNEFISGKNVSPIIEIYKMDSSTLFATEVLLNSDESYEIINNESNKKLVTKESKLTDVYNALFSENDNTSMQIGDLRINSHTRNYIKRIEGILTDTSDFLI